MAESIDEPLAREAQRAEEQKKREDLMQRDQQERLAQEQAEEEAAEEGYDGEPLEPDMSRPGQMDAAKEYAAQAAKRAMRRYGKEIAGKAAARYGATAVIGATSWAWGPIALIIGGIILIFALLMVILLGIIATCNQDGFTGALVRFSSSIAAKIGISEDICEQLAITETDLSSGGRSGGAGGGASFDTSGKLTDAQARIYLEQADVGWNNPFPTTSFEAINTSTILEATRFKAACDLWASGLTPPQEPCVVVLTGGTEGGHAAGACSHTNGFKFDMRLNDRVNLYIESTFTRIKDRTDNAQQYVGDSGWIYAKESNHWDVLVGCGQVIEDR